jgi:hypothetical protein
MILDQLSHFSRFHGKSGSYAFARTEEGERFYDGEGSEFDSACEVMIFGKRLLALQSSRQCIVTELRHYPGFMSFSQY